MENPRRLKALKAFRKRRPHHRYNGWRTLGLSISWGILLGVPTVGLARVDLWRGNHLVLFEPAPFNVALAVVIGAFALIYGTTFLINLVAGRMLCGWGCPVGQLHRMTEERRAPWWRTLMALLYAALLPLSVLLWWCDPRILIEGPTTARIAIWSGLLLLTLTAFAHGRWWSWNFCQQACPIGLYYSFVAPARWFGITFPRAENCIECNLCDHVCPVGLLPRSLPDPVPYRGGISIADAPGRNHCLECGDCVRACEWIVGQQTGKEAPLELGFHSPAPRGKEHHEFTAHTSGA